MRLFRRQMICRVQHDPGRSERVRAEWADLSRRAHELPRIIDECVTAVEIAFGLRQKAA